MTKKIITTDIGEEKCFDAERYQPIPTAIDELLGWINDIKSKGATHIKWEAKTDYDGDSSEVTAHGYNEREETDAEYNERLAAQTTY